MNYNLQLALESPLHWYKLLWYLITFCDNTPSCVMVLHRVYFQILCCSALVFAFISLALWCVAFISRLKQRDHFFIVNLSVHLSVHQTLMYWSAYEAAHVFLWTLLFTVIVYFMHNTWFMSEVWVSVKLFILNKKYSTMCSFFF